jgi:hypothetical protein
MFLSQAWEGRRQDVIYDDSLCLTMCNKDYSLSVMMGWVLDGAQSPEGLNLHAYMHTYMHIYVHTYMHIYMHICTHIHRATCVSVMTGWVLEGAQSPEGLNIHAYMHTCTYIHAYVHTRTQGYVCIRHEGVGA